MAKKKATARPVAFRTNVSLPLTMLDALKTALLRRRVLAEVNGKKPAITFSGWVREQAEGTIEAFK